MANSPDVEKCHVCGERHEMAVTPNPIMQNGVCPYRVDGIQEVLDKQMMEMAPVTVLKWLLMGGEICLDRTERVYALIDDRLCVKVVKLRPETFKTGIGDIKILLEESGDFMQVDYTLSNFIQLCRELDPDTVFSATANMALNEVKKR